MQAPVATQKSAGARESSPREAGELLKVSDLTVRYTLRNQQCTALDQVTFEINRGEVVGLLGESGCGKTTTALALMGLLPSNAHVVSGSAFFDGQDLVGLNERELSRIRGSQLSLIYQDSATLNPVMRVGDQIREVLRAHKSVSLRHAHEEIEALLTEVGFKDVGRIYGAYPHQLSGGQRQRISIAQALICKPRLVIADEPTASVDRDTAAEIVDCILRLKNSLDTAFLLISHDPRMIEALADRVLVMYAGQVAESGPVRDTFTEPLHPYTHALLQCATPSGASGSTRDRRLPFIPGAAPDPMNMPPGCAFSSRCADRMEICDSRSPASISTSKTRSVRCLKYEA